MARYDTTALQARIIRMAKIPAGSTYADPATLLDIASSEMEQRIVPELIRISGGHLMAYRDTAYTQGTSRYRLPPRNIRPERVEVVNSSGMLLGALRLARGAMVDEVLAGRCPPGDAFGFWCPENSHAALALRTSESSSSRYVRIWYRRQPNRLIATASAWKIAFVSGDPTDVIDVEPINDETPGDPDIDVAYDVIKATPGFEAAAEDVVFTSSTGSTNITFPDGSEPTGLEVGDYIAPAGYTPVPQLPVALHGALEAHAAAQVMLEMGNPQGGEAMRQVAERRMEVALSTATPRSDEAETVSGGPWD